MDAPTPNFPEKPARSPRPRGGHSLRTWRSDQNLKVDIGGLGLLPSPPMTESRPSSAGPESSYFKFEISEPRSATMEPSQRWVGELNEDISEDLNEDLELNLDTDMSEYSEPSTTDKAEHNDEPVVGETESNEPIEEDLTPTAPELDVDEKLKYQAYYPPDWKNQPRTDVMNVHEAHSELLRHCESDSEQSSPAPESDALDPPSIKSPKSPHSNLGLPPGSSPRPQRSRTATVSSEASWVPSNFSYCERWLQCVPTDGVNEESSPMKEFNNRRKFQIVENDPPMPKLDIIPGAKALEEPVRFVVASKTKPKLVDIARQSPVSVALPPPPSLLPQTVPTTPDQRQEEVSAFSPDTPLDMSDSGYGTRDSRYSFDSYDDGKPDDDDAYTDPGSLTSSDSVGSTVVCERPESAQGERELQQLEIRSGSVSPKAASPAPPPSPGRSSNKSEKQDEKPQLWPQDWNLDDHEWTLDELDHSVKDFPRNMLRLTSPVILFLRKSDEEPFIKPFRTIFPDVSENLLDCLCAALLARNYLLSLSAKHRNKPSVSTRNDYIADSVPTKAYSTLGIQIPSASTTKPKDRVFAARSVELRPHLERIVDNLLFAICGRSDPTLKAAVEVLAQVLETKA
ncbi:hypothetical protein N7541_004757 [Penicillium brevicompactum]|uniref:Uncharacterized protein n=1 Tax=Penicillium brevicompactum TaxID=5074 RepID=A0A9W9RE33_PENBR|nr:hypothetical protein N7541_004757 [Penicillium brevicompactum]